MSYGDGFLLLVQAGKVRPSRGPVAKKRQGNKSVVCTKELSSITFLKSEEIIK